MFTTADCIASVQFTLIQSDYSYLLSINILAHQSHRFPMTNVQQELNMHHMRSKSVSAARFFWALGLCSRPMEPRRDRCNYRRYDHGHRICSAIWSSVVLSTMQGNHRCKVGSKTVESLYTAHRNPKPLISITGFILNDGR